MNSYPFDKPGSTLSPSILALLLRIEITPALLKGSQQTLGSASSSHGTSILTAAFCFVAASGDVLLVCKGACKIPAGHHSTCLQPCRHAHLQSTAAKR